MIDKLVWFIDTRDLVADSSIEKIIGICKAFDSHVDIVLDKRVRSFERLYWKHLPNYEEESRALTAQQDQMTSLISRQFEENGIYFQTHEINNQKYMNKLKELLSKQSLFVIQNQIKARRHPVFQFLEELQTNILLITDSHWKSKLSIASAVDPLHENSKEAKLDHYVVSAGREWRKKMGAKWYLVHSAYVPPNFVKYKSTILNIHREGLEDFAKEVSVASQDTVVLIGMPEDTLPKWTKLEGIEILALGLKARNTIEKLWIGSTTQALLESPPCDMLLVKH